MLRRLRSAVRPLSSIVRVDLGHRGDHSVTTSKAQVTVVDLHNLPDRAQRFVVGVALRQEFRRKELQGTATVFLYDGGSSTVKKHTIKAVGVRDNRLIVTEGLGAGDIIASAGVSYLSDGQKVKLLPLQE